MQSNQAAAWENPGGGFGVCTTWGRRSDDCGIDFGVPDQVYRLNGTMGGGGLTFDSAFSEKGPFDIALPLDGSGVEDRTGGPDKRYSIYLQFSADLASVGGAVTSCGTVLDFGVDQDVPSQAVVDLQNVNCNESHITVTVTDVVDVNGNSLPSSSISFGLLIADVNGDGVVDRFDRKAVKSDLGQVADESNFREDCSQNGHNSTGYINASDLRLVDRQQGTHL